MAGIGKYTKGAKFELKSGNSPAFKMMGTPEAGDSPITDESGIVKGTSPYKAPPLGIDEKKGGGWKKAGVIALGALTSGLDAAYGSGKIMPKSSDRLKKDKKEIKGYSDIQAILDAQTNT
jgi:hypothetical protein